MATLLEEVLASNKKFLAENDYSEPTSKYPKRNLAIVTCMDSRLVDLSNKALGINRGDAKIIQNAGNSIIEDRGETIKSLIVAVYILGVEEIMIIGHHDCGVAHTTYDAMIKAMKARGMDDTKLSQLDDRLKSWLDNFTDPGDNVLEVIKKIKNNPFIPNDIPIHGLLIDPNTGKLDLLVDGYKDLIKN